MRWLGKKDPNLLRAVFVARAKSIFLDAVPDALVGRCCPIEVRKYPPRPREMPALPRPRLVVLTNDHKIGELIQAMEDKLTKIINDELGFELISGLQIKVCGSKMLSDAIQTLAESRKANSE